MLFMIRFTDEPANIAVRHEHLADHLAWLEARKATVLVAGSLRSEGVDAPDGALWLVSADSFDAACRCYLTDPFWRHGLRRSVEIKSWSKAFDIPVEV